MPWLRVASCGAGLREHFWTEIDFPEDYQRAREEILPQIPASVPLQSVATSEER